MYFYDKRNKSIQEFDYLVPIDGVEYINFCKVNKSKIDSGEYDLEYDGTEFSLQEKKVILVLEDNGRFYFSENGYGVEYPVSVMKKVNEEKNNGYLHWYDGKNIQKVKLKSNQSFDWINHRVINNDIQTAITKRNILLASNVKQKVKEYGVTFYVEDILCRYPVTSESLMILNLISNNKSNDVILKVVNVATQEPMFLRGDAINDSLLSIMIDKVIFMTAYLDAVVDKFINDLNLMNVNERSLDIIKSCDDYLNIISERLDRGDF